MEMKTVKKWSVLFLGILTAIVIADYLSTFLVAAAGLTGWTRFVASFILYALLFFAALYGIERVTGIRFFWCGCSDDPY